MVEYVALPASLDLSNQLTCHSIAFPSEQCLGASLPTKYNGSLEAVHARFDDIIYDLVEFLAGQS